MRAIDADRLQKQFDEKSTNPNYRVNMHNIKSIISNAPIVEVYTKKEVIDMLYDITHQIQETEKIVDSNTAGYWWKEGIRDSVNVIQSRINILKVVQEKRSKYDKD